MQEKEKLVIVSVKIPESTLKCLDRLAKDGPFKSRSAVIRYLIEMSLKRMDICA